MQYPVTLAPSTTGRAPIVWYLSCRVAEINADNADRDEENDYGDSHFSSKEVPSSRTSLKTGLNPKNAFFASFTSGVGLLVVVSDEIIYKTCTNWT